ncbi:glycerol dehydratase reactivase beta/small subunit family protein [Clostridium peptidivorans]|uniref:glycerol dehydratase reactivase beta/small subunit family protein n=1 Tax=Clostridium peptidivorans TaxID=100174 RepID=UPI000BE3B433|nr:glycerol dehydratase reactivase beta/small subunit family protein [Clostridium peptidivorans]
MIMSNVEKPAIFVITNNAEKLILKELLAGIEEEGIPYDVKNITFNESNVLRYLHEASQKSRMGIAVAIINNRIILHHNKLKQEKPLIDITLNFYNKKEKARTIGSNAARLYKVMPLKNINNLDDELTEKITETVISVLKNLDIEIHREGF